MKPQRCMSWSLGPRISAQFLLVTRASWHEHRGLCPCAVSVGCVREHLCGCVGDCVGGCACVPLAGKGLQDRRDIGVPGWSRKQVYSSVWEQVSWGAATPGPVVWYLVQGVTYRLQLGLLDTNKAHARPKSIGVRFAQRLDCPPWRCPACCAHVAPHVAPHVVPMLCCLGRCRHCLVIV